MTVLPDGSLLFPKRGKPPEYNNPNYKRDERNPYKFIPVWNECQYRKILIEVLPCGRQKTDYRCGLDNTGICFSICNNCRKVKEMWKSGPLPANTWNWGAVVTKDIENTGGFYFADFKGDHVILYADNQRIEASDIIYYNNSIEAAPTH